MASPPEFPATIGPFLMSSANLARAFNSFYSQHSFIPRPDPSSSENSMAGMDPNAAGMGQGEIVFCQLSPLHAITLDAETKKAANIPAAAVHFAWAYPLVLEPGVQRPRGAAEAAFVEYGGYIYFDDHRSVVGTNSIAPAAFGTLGLMFGRPQPLPEGVVDTMTKQGRFQEVTLDPLKNKGATHFGWIRPTEFPDDVASADGCFAYKFADGAKYFPVVSKPVFTKELLEEELDDSEAWVAVRGATRKPSAEVVIVFDKAKTFEENIYNNSHGVQVSESIADVRIGRDSQRVHNMGYGEWQGSAEQGTISDPWIFNLILGAPEPSGTDAGVSSAAELEASVLGLELA